MRSSCGLSRPWGSLGHLKEVLRASLLRIGELLEQTEPGASWVLVQSHLQCTFWAGAQRMET